MDKRQKQILVMYQEGITYQKIGDRFGVSRERIRQILNHILRGKPNRLELQRNQKKIEREIQMSKIKFYCKRCEKPVTYGESKNKREFCSGECRNKYEASFRKGTAKCSYCGEYYPPFRNKSWMPSKRSFCSFEHYNKWRHEVRGQGILRWTNKERDLFILSLREKGKSYEEIKKIVGKINIHTLSAIVYYTKRKLYGN